MRCGRGGLLTALAAAWTVAACGPDGGVGADASDGGDAAGEDAPCNCSTDAGGDLGACTTAFCDTDVCQYRTVHVVDQTPCDDLDWCTQVDTCLAGECVGGSPRDCSMLDEGCILGACDPVLKACKPVPVPDGTPCDDHNSCTSSEHCKAGVCTGDPDAPSGCPGDACDEEGNCLIGNDGNKCNGDFVCDHVQHPPPYQHGKCVLTSPKQCSSTTPPCKVNKCIPLTGECVLVNVKDGDPCDDGDPCTEGDACQTGQCVPGAPACG
jgi:hypothetical protein